jgi:hypothetical protein
LVLDHRQYPAISNLHDGFHLVQEKPFDLLAKGLLSENWLTIADKIRNVCVTSPLEDSKQIEDVLALAS